MKREHKKITVVYNKKTLRMYPFTYSPKGEIVLPVYSGVDLLDDPNIVVGIMDVSKLDFETMNIIPDNFKG